MEFWNRRLLLQNEDVPLSMPPLSHTHTKHATNASSSSPPQSSAFQFQSPLQVSIPPVFSSSVAYVFLILFTTFFFVGFVFLYFRQFASDAAAAGSYRRRWEEGAAAAAEAKKCLPVVAHCGEGCAECAICLEELREGDAVKMIPYCKHVFHPHCIDTWLDKQVTCPVCRCSELCGAAQQSGEEVGSVSATRQQVEQEEQEVVPIPNLD